MKFKLGHFVEMDGLTKLTSHRKNPLFHLHRDCGDSPSQPADRDDGGHLRKDCRDQERVDETGDEDVGGVGVHGVGHEDDGGGHLCKD